MLDACHGQSSLNSSSVNRALKPGVYFLAELPQVDAVVRFTSGNRSLGVAAVLLLGSVSMESAIVTTRDGKSYEGEVFLEPGNTVSVTLPDSTRLAIALTNVRVATFTSPQLSMAQFSAIDEGWTNVDIGEVSIAGIAGQSNRLFAIQVASADIGGRADSLHYAYFRTSDDVDVIARVASIGGADRLARAGLMIRDSLKPESKCVFAGVNAAGELSLLHRPDSGGKAINTTNSMQVSLPCWLKISRREKIFTAYRSNDGKQWEQFGAAQTSIRDASYYAGLAVTSHSGFSFCTAQIDEVSRTIGGVCGEYFADRAFSTLVTNRVEPAVNFQWVGEPPVEGLRFNNFSVRWTGEIEPKYSEPYTFYYDAEDAQLWVNGQEVPHIPLRREARDKVATPLPLLLKAGNRYPFKFEYRHTDPVRNPVRLGWSSQSQGKEILPSKRLFCTLEARGKSGARLTAQSAWVMGRGIMLRNGTFISGQIQSVSEAGVKFTYRGDTEYALPVHQVARTVFRVSPRNGMLSDRELPAGALLGNGDFLEGQVQLGSGRSVKVSSVLLGLRSFSLDGSDLAALVLNDPNPTPARYQLRLADNSVIVAKSINVEQQEVSIVEPIIGALRIPREVVTEIRSEAASARWRVEH
jgi:PA14 domain-containing protein